MIDSFDGKFRFLSNFYRLSVPLRYEGVSFPTVEHAYQAAKTLNIADREAIARLDTPGAAKRYGRILKPLRPNWDNIRIEIMYTLLTEKFKDPFLRSCLLATGTEELVEGNDWRDRFWGVYAGEGENHLGQLLMRIRAELEDKLYGPSRRKKKG